METLNIHVLCKNYDGFSCEEYCTDKTLGFDRRVPLEILLSACAQQLSEKADRGSRPSIGIKTLTFITFSVLRKGLQF